VYVRKALQKFNSSSMRKEIPRTLETDFSQGFLTCLYHEPHISPATNIL